MNHVREVQHIETALSSERKLKERQIWRPRGRSEIIFKQVAMRSVKEKLSELN
jgi:hypothetical protein